MTGLATRCNQVHGASLSFRVMNGGTKRLHHAIHSSSVSGGRLDAWPMISLGYGGGGGWRPVAVVRHPAFACRGIARRGRRCPAGAHAVAVGLAGQVVPVTLFVRQGRLRCGARPEVAPRNSLRSLRSLRSNSRGESVHEAREYTRRPRGCAPRRPRVSPCRAPPVANTTACCSRLRTSPGRTSATGRQPSSSLMHSTTNGRQSILGTTGPHPRRTQLFDARRPLGIAAVELVGQQRGVALH